MKRSPNPNRTAGLQQSTLLAHQAIDLIGGLVGLIAQPLVGGSTNSSQPTSARCRSEKPCGSSRDCDCGCDCGCDGARRFYATTDIKLETRQGEQRVVSVLVENNRPREATIAFKVGPWLDAEGRAVAIPVAFSPPSVTLKPGESVAVRALVQVTESAQPGMTYFTEFVLEGCSFRPITVGMRVQPERCHDIFVACDECRPSRGHFVEYCHDCGHDHGCGCDCKCEDPCRAGDPVPHHHWVDPCGCTRYYRAA